MNKLNVKESYELLTAISVYKKRNNAAVKLNITRQTLNNRLHHLEDLFGTVLINAHGLTYDGKVVLNKLEEVHLSLMSLVPSDETLEIDIALMCDEIIKLNFSTYKYNYLDSIISDFNEGLSNIVITSEYASKRINFDKKDLLKAYQVYAIGNPNAKGVVLSSDKCLAVHLFKHNIEVDMYDSPIEDILLQLVNGDIYLYTLFPNNFNSLNLESSKINIGFLIYNIYTKNSKCKKD